jgi:hypothetical protein
LGTAPTADEFVDEFVAAAVAAAVVDAAVAATVCAFPRPGESSVIALAAASVANAKNPEREARRERRDRGSMIILFAALVQGIEREIYPVFVIWQTG